MLCNPHTLSYESLPTLHPAAWPPGRLTTVLHRLRGLPCLAAFLLDFAAPSGD